MTGPINPFLIHQKDQSEHFDDGYTGNYLSINGRVLYLATKPRQDITVAVTVLGLRVERPTPMDLAMAKECCATYREQSI